LLPIYAGTYVTSQLESNWQKEELRPIMVNDGEGAFLSFSLYAHIVG
jgi:hypothetical protein